MKYNIEPLFLKDIKIALTILVANFLLLSPSYAESSKEGTRHTYLTSMVIAYASPITVETVVNPKKVITPVPRRFVKPRGNCMATVRAAGYFVPRTTDGYARTVLVSSEELPPEGVPVVIKTAESKLGHVLVAVNKGGKLISLIEGNHPIGEGRIVPLSLYRGYI